MFFPKNGTKKFVRGRRRPAEKSLKQRLRSRPYVCIDNAVVVISTRCNPTSLRRTLHRESENTTLGYAGRGQVTAVDRGSGPGLLFLVVQSTIPVKEREGRLEKKRRSSRSSMSSSELLPSRTPALLTEIWEPWVCAYVHTCVMCQRYACLCAYTPWYRNPGGPAHHPHSE